MTLNKNKITQFLLLITPILLGIGIIIQLGVKYFTPVLEKLIVARPVLAYSPDLASRSEKSLRDDLVWDIYGLESTWGKNDGCRAQGKYNGFGLGWYGGKKPCFNTFAEASNAVHAWVQSMQEQGYDTATLLCYYNTGKLISDCEYFNKYLTLK